MQQWVQRVTHVVVSLSPLVDHDYAWLVEVKLEVLGWIKVQCARVVVGDGHARLTHIGVRSVNIDFVEPCTFNQYILNGRLAHARLALQVNAVVARVEQEVNRLCEVDAAGEFNI